MSKTGEHILDRILAEKRDELHLLRAYGTAELCHEQAEAAPPARGFARALRARAEQRGIAVIAEIKKASPSKGMIRPDAEFDPARIAEQYATAGAACLSVLTDREFFKGAPEHLEDARDACDLPVLRKDFTIDELQVCEARALGADCVLLIAAALDDDSMRELAAKALDMNMDVLAEVHTATELDRVLQLDERCLIGINNRDLRTFETSLDTTLALSERVPDDRLLVSESGIHSREDIRRLRDAGVTAFLIGESLLRQPDPGAALSKLLETGNDS